MNDATFEALSARGLSLLRFSDARVLQETKTGHNRFSLIFAHSDARRGRRGSLVLVQFLATSEPDEEEQVSEYLRLGTIGSVAAVSTFQSRVVFENMRGITPATLTELLAEITDPNLAHHARALGSDTTRFSTVSEKLGRAILRRLADRVENAAVLLALAGQANRPRRYVDGRALQVDAIRTAMRAFGSENAALVEFEGEDSMLATVRIQEDAVIEHDARHMPRWSLESSDYTGRAVFRRDDAVLEVYTANKRPLEELFGVDLIYLSHRHRAIVMVQYKMMEPYETPEELKARKATDRGDWRVPIDEQFRSELQRMSTFDRDLAPDGHYRLSSSPFFIKLVKRGAETNAAGIILSLAHLQHLIATGGAAGPRGGLRISYQELDGHYLRADALVELIRSGYIGSRDATTDQLETLMEAAVRGGRSVVAAIERGWPK